MKEIPLSQGQVAIVDDEDFEHISQWNWCAAWKRNTKGFYAQRFLYVRGSRKGRSLQMHRVILGLEIGDKTQVDHINRNALDNRRLNLRIATPRQNSCNRKARADSATGFKGVCRQVSGNFQAYIHRDGKKKVIGTFPTAPLASAAYFKAAQELFGEFACDGISRSGRDLAETDAA